MLTTVVILKTPKMANRVQMMFTNHTEERQRQKGEYVLEYLFIFYIMLYSRENSVKPSN